MSADRAAGSACAARCSCCSPAPWCCSSWSPPSPCSPTAAPSTCSPRSAATEASRLAARLAEALPTGRLPAAEELRRLAPRAGPGGDRRRRRRDAGRSRRPRPTNRRRGRCSPPSASGAAANSTEAVGLGPDESAAGRRSPASRRWVAAGRRRFVRVDLAAGALAPQLRGVRRAVGGGADGQRRPGRPPGALPAPPGHPLRPAGRAGPPARRRRGRGGGRGGAAAPHPGAGVRRPGGRRRDGRRRPARRHRRPCGAPSPPAWRAACCCSTATARWSPSTRSAPSCSAVTRRPRRAPPPTGEVFAAYPELAGLLADAVAGRGGVRRRELAVETPAGAPRPWGSPSTCCAATTAGCAASWCSSPTSPRAGGGRGRRSSPTAWPDSASWPPGWLTSCATASPPCAAT